MSSIKTIHILSDVIIKTFFLVVFILSITFKRFTIEIGFLLLVTFVWSIYFSFSYFKTKIENNYFKFSGYINLFASISILICIPLSIYIYFPYPGFPLWIYSVLSQFFTLSFIIFLVGYYKNKK